MTSNEKIIKKNLLSLSHEDLAELTLQYMWECKLYKTDQNAKAVDALKSVLKDIQKQQFFSLNNIAYIIHPIKIACIILDKIKELEEKEVEDE